MKKFISLFTVFFLLLSVLGTVQVSVSAALPWIDFSFGYINGELPEQNMKFTSYADFESFINENSSLLDSEFMAGKDRYDEMFFDDYCLYLCTLAANESSGSIFELSGIDREKNKLDFDITRTSIGVTDDCVTHMLILGLINSYADDDLDITVADEYIYISTAGQLKDFADDVNSGNSYEGKAVVLENDIDLSEICGEDINGEEVSWTPIGDVTNYFSGIFNGNGHTVSGLYINSTDPQENYIGLFGYTSGSVIKNLNIGGLINAEAYEDNFKIVGAVAGDDYGIIVNCHNKAAVKVSDFVLAGGIAGCSRIIRKCSNTGEISGAMAGGGICYENKGVVEDCYNAGSVIGDGGGICGMYVGGCAKNCYNIGMIEGVYNIGGIVGDSIGGDTENSYYLEGCNAPGTAFVNDSGTAKTAEQFASGEVAYLLGEAWGQEIGVDEYPVLGGKKVYRIERENGYEYTNTPQESIYPYTINSIRIVDETGAEYEAPPSDRSFIVDIEVTKHKERFGKDYFIVAVYDTNGHMISMNYIKANIAADSSFSCGVNIPKTNTEIGSVKAFVWNSLVSISWLSESVTY